MFNLGKFGVAIELDSTQFDTNMKNAEKRINNTSKGLGGFAKGVAKIAGGIGVFKLVETGFNMIKGSIDGAISRVDTLKQFPKVLQQMGYGADEAEKATAKLIDGIDGLPTTLNGITADVQRLVNVFQDVDLATESAVGLNNAFLASGASQDQASRGLDQYIKMLSTGKVNMQSWQTLQETMPYALQQTAEAFEFTGKTAQNDFYDALKSGDITMDQFNSKIIELSDAQGGFADVAIDATKGIRTSWGNIQTAIVNGVAKSITAFDDWLESKGFGGISGVLDKIKIAVGNAFGKVNEIIPVVLDWFGVLFEKISESTAFSTMIELVSNLINKFGGLEGIVQAVLPFIQSYLSAFVEFWTGLFSGDGNLGEFFVNMINKIKEIAVPILQDAVAFIQSILGQLQTFWEENGQSIVEAVKNAFSMIASIIEFIMPAVQFVVEFVWNSIKGVIKGALDVILGAIKIFSGLFTGDWSKMWEGVKQLLSGAVKLILNLMNLSFVGGIRKLLASLAKSGLSIIKGMGTNILNAFKSLGTGALNTVKNMVSGVINFFKNLVTQGISNFNTLRTFGASIFSAIRQVITNSISTMVGSVKKLITGMASSVKGTFSGILNTAKTIFNSVKNAITNPVQTAQKAVKATVDKIKGFFTGMKLSIPSIKLPKLPKPKITGKFSLTPPSVPKISWNAKGGIFDTPTIFNTNKGLQGVGEAGPEAIIPLSSKVLAGIGKGISQNMQGGDGNNSESNTLLQEQNKLLKQLVNKDNNTYLDGKNITQNVSDRQGDRYTINSFIKGNR